ncbi:MULTISPECIES: alpha/beta hydrolase [Pseudonocardia]|uniref:Alpha/beta hydrolase family protein n=1 Tax=Pseudonocardia oroxyli TaxID=366584 RepID=A0A1G7KAM2_PSEOR|nr:MULTISPECIES: alpha/beta fold hydrolase [Pseudonocardia]MCF7550115.1 alpha/beta fold hydrolase [Pseudonocardia sp. WMMC193]SDF34091.1 Alpha/beta hydrolase family protein [Pseudonocardia oroxyli]
MSLPRLEPVGSPPEDPRALVVVAHGGRSRSSESGERRRLTYWRMLPFARLLARTEGLAVAMVRYRLRGWNGPARDAARDVAELLTGDLPTVLVGHSMGGRAVLHAAGAPQVRAVAALAPWLDGSDPVDQLAGRDVLIAHGDRERMTDPRESLAYAVRARQVTRVARFDVHGDGHAMLRHAADWHSLVQRFVLGELGFEPEDPAITNAMRQPTPGGLEVPLGALR